MVTKTSKESSYIKVYSSTSTKEFHSYELNELIELSEDIGATYLDWYEWSSLTEEDIYLCKSHISSLLKRADFYIDMMGLYWYGLKDILEAANIRMRVDYSNFSPVRLLEVEEINSRVKVLEQKQKTEIVDSERFYKLSHTEGLYKELKELKEFNWEVINLIPEALYCNFSKEVEEKLKPEVEKLRKWVLMHQKVSDYLINKIISNYKQEDSGEYEAPIYHNLVQWYIDDPDSLYNKYLPSLREAAVYFKDSLKVLEIQLLDIKDLNSTNSSYII